MPSFFYLYFPTRFLGELLIFMFIRVYSASNFYMNTKEYDSGTAFPDDLLCFETFTKRQREKR